MYINFTPSFCDKYATLTLMAKQKVLTSEEIKAIKKAKEALIKATTEEGVKK